MQAVQYSIVYSERDRLKEQFAAQLATQRDQLESTLAERTRELDVQEAVCEERVQAALDEAEDAKRNVADLTEIVAIMRRDLEAETARADKATADLEEETRRADEACAGWEEETARANKAEAEVEAESLRSFNDALTQSGVEYSKKVIRVRDKFYLSGGIWRWPRWGSRRVTLLTNYHRHCPSPLPPRATSSPLILRQGARPVQVLALKPQLRFRLILRQAQPLMPPSPESEI